MNLPGGGGFYDPLERDPELVLVDVRNGIVSVEAARSRYGVDIDLVTNTIDIVATQREREIRRRQPATV